MSATVVRADSGGLAGSTTRVQRVDDVLEPGLHAGVVQCGVIGRTVVTPGLVRMSS